ncbi:MAG: DUF2946 family protein [Burkholderiales bacterium]
MDEAVRAALARWPGVPDVYGWLRLDARGRWLTRAHDFEKSKRYEAIAHAAFNAFIGRNYQADPRSCWYFQNGPQRVFVELACAPWVLRMDLDGTLATHTGRGIAQVSAVMVDEDGRPGMQTDIGAASLDDRDLERFLMRLTDAKGGRGDDALEALLGGDAPIAPSFTYAGQHLVLERVPRDAWPQRLSYVRNPAPD